MDWQPPSSSQNPSSSSSTTTKWTPSNHPQEPHLALSPPSESTNEATPPQLTHLTHAQTALYHATHAMHTEALSLTPETRTNVHALIASLWDADIDDMRTREDVLGHEEGRGGAGEANAVAEAGKMLVLKARFVEWLFGILKEEEVGRNEALCLLVWVGEVASGTWEGISGQAWEGDGSDGGVGGGRNENGEFYGDGEMVDDEMVEEKDEI